MGRMLTFRYVAIQPIDVPAYTGTKYLVQLFQALPGSHSLLLDLQDAIENCYSGKAK